MCACVTRWLKSSGVSLSSERKQRIIAKEQIGDNLETENAPFSSSISLVEGRKLEQQHTPSFQTWSTKSFNFWNKMKSILNNAQHLRNISNL